jgi:uncharacterized protein YkwD
MRREVGMRSKTSTSGGAFGALLLPWAAALAISLLMGACGSGNAVLSEEDPNLAIEMKILDRVNGYRCAEGLDELRWSRTLADMARVHAERLAGGYPLGHGCFEFRALLATGMMGGGILRENVGRVSGGRHPASEFLRAWLLSPGHRRIIRSEADLSGVGIARCPDGYIYAVELFFKRTGENFVHVAGRDPRRAYF